MVQYDENIIQGFADALYARATSIVAGYVIIGVIAGLAVGAFSGNSAYSIVGAIVGGAIGWWLAQGAAFALRLLAQTSLCQVQIEKNTRSSSGSSVRQMSTKAEVPVAPPSAPLQARTPVISAKPAMPASSPAPSPPRVLAKEPTPKKRSWWS